MPKQAMGVRHPASPACVCRHSEEQGVAIGHHVQESVSSFPIDGHGRRFGEPRQPGLPVTQRLVSTDSVHEIGHISDDVRGSPL